MKAIIIVLIFCLSTTLKLKADDVERPLSIEILDIKYNYELYRVDVSSELVARGPMIITAKVSDNTVKVLFNYTRSHISENDRIRFLGNYYQTVDNADEPIVINRPIAYMGTYFRLAAIDENNKRVYSPTYYTTDFISPEDLEKIKNIAAIDDVEYNDAATLSFSNQTLTVTTPNSTFLTVYDLTGRTLYSGEIRSSATIPLPSHFIIVQYKSGDDLITKKLISK